MHSALALLPRSLDTAPRAYSRGGPDKLSLTDLTELVHAVASTPALWEPHVRIPSSSQRWWMRLAGDRRVDVWLLSWLPGHTTDLHDHGPSAAAFAVVRGRLAEDRVDGTARHTTYTRLPGSVTWLAPGVIHDVRGAGDRPAVSIHAYSPPLSEMNYHARDEQGRLRLVRSVRTDQPEGEMDR